MYVGFCQKSKNVIKFEHLRVLCSNAKQKNPTHCCTELDRNRYFSNNNFFESTNPPASILQK